MTVEDRRTSSLRHRIVERLRADRRAYAQNAEDERPLTGYLSAMGTFTVLTLVTSELSRRRGTAQPLPLKDLLLLGAATHKLARILAKDAVASPLRAPFTRYAGPAGPGEVNEEVRVQGYGHAVGELLTCPFCLAPWIATTLLAGRALAPALTRQTVHVFTAVTVADLLQFVYAGLEQAAE